ncbi:MAG: hypothetical protein KDA21_11755 [Phycisphaerales bacterium]|nr:hypothetical protein [Phycisphaerales bacterium]
MRDVICVIGVVACAASANGAFRLISIELGGTGGAAGSPIQIADPASAFYQDGAGNNYPPSSADIVITPSLEHDSYIAMDSFGPSSPVYTASAPAGSQPDPPYNANGGHFDVPNELSGGFFGDVDAAPNPIFGGSLTVFFGQLTVPTGDVLVGLDMVVTTIGDRAGNDGTRSLTLNGAPNGRLCGISYLYDSTVFGDKYYMYIYEIPAPGAAGLLAGAGLFGVLRRRR